MKQSFEQPDPTYARLVEYYARFINSTPEKLRFLRTALDKYHLSPLAERIGWLKQITFRKAIIEELVQFLPEDSPKPREVSLVYWLYRVRYPLYFTATLLIVVSTIATAQWAYGTARNAGVFDLRLMRPEAGQPTAVSAAPPIVATPTPTATPSAPLPDGESNVEGFTPEQIWLVERTKDYEEYSNGGRILIDQQVETEPRSFYALRRKQFKGAVALPFDAHQAAFYPELRDKPVGILYHTTQSDVVPFLPRNNKNIKGNIEHLIGYIQQEHLYNYLIDRFGRIHCIVRDDHYANHSGNSIWSDQNNVYINLNHSFIGVAFEGNWSADVKLSPDDINEAQLYAGKILTAILRSKYNIADVNCVTHGMVSINPTDFLIGFHLDWAKGFPFAMLGLRDKYQQPPASIVEFGFKYDRGFEHAIGGVLWPGIVLAEARLKARAADLGLSVEALRRQLQGDFTLYRKWLKDQREQAKTTGKSRSSEPGDETVPRNLFSTQ